MLLRFEDMTLQSISKPKNRVPVEAKEELSLKTKSNYITSVKMIGWKMTIKQIITAFLINDVHCCILKISLKRKTTQYVWLILLMASQKKQKTTWRFRLKMAEPISLWILFSPNLLHRNHLMRVGDNSDILISFSHHSVTNNNSRMLTDTNTLIIQ